MLITHTMNQLFVLCSLFGYFIALFYLLYPLGLINLPYLLPYQHLHKPYQYYFVPYQYYCVALQDFFQFQVEMSTFKVNKSINFLLSKYNFMMLISCKKLYLVKVFLVCVRERDGKVCIQ